jgi:ubiquinone/menaquinone biosynthesis C-methylase UbiE
MKVSAGCAEALPFSDESFDAVFAGAVVHNATDPNALCREVFRMLRPGGGFIAARERVISHLEDLPAFLAAHPLHIKGSRKHDCVLGS